MVSLDFVAQMISLLVLDDDMLGGNVNPQASKSLCSVVDLARATWEILFLHLNFDAQVIISIRTLSIASQSDSRGSLKLQLLRSAAGSSFTWSFLFSGNSVPNRIFFSPQPFRRLPTATSLFAWVPGCVT